MIVRAAELALQGFSGRFIAPETDSRALRTQLLNTPSAQQRGHLALKELLDYAWSCGVPVLHVRNFGDNKKMDAAVVNVDDRPVIAICRDDKAHAKVAYKLAHELGHIACGHWREYGFIADVELKQDDHDVIEREADAYGCSLIYGDEAFKFSNLGVEAHEVIEVGAMTKVDPHALLLSFLREFGKEKKSLYRTYDSLNRALSAGQNARLLILERLFTEIDCDLLTAEERRQLMVISEAADVVGTPS